MPFKKSFSRKINNSAKVKVLAIMQNKKKMLVSVLLFCSLFLNAQSFPHNIGSISITDSLSLGQINYMYFNQGRCIIIETGLAVLKEKKVQSGNFSLNCHEAESNISFVPCPLTVYPNPTANLTNVSTTACYNAYVWLKGLMIVSNIAGQIIDKREIVVADLRSGIRVNLTTLSAGTYLITVVFQSVKQTIKVIKI